MKKYGRNFGRKNMENKKKKLSAYYKPYKGLFLADMVFAMIGAAITLVIPLMVRGSILDHHPAGDFYGAAGDRRRIL